MDNQTVALKATQDLMDIVHKQAKEQRDARQENDEKPFLYGKNFETLPEVWELDDGFYCDTGLAHIPYYGEIS